MKKLFALLLAALMLMTCTALAEDTGLADVMAKGKLIMGFDGGIRNSRLEIESLDAALVAPFGRRLLEYGVTDLVPEPWFNLYNNIWNTNFPMWFGDDVRFRFVLHDRK